MTDTLADEQVLTFAQVGEVLGGVSAKTVRRRIADGSLPLRVVRVGRKQLISVRRLREFIEGEGE
jgi:hypothetical protein